jgi:beta-lactamase class A
MMIHGRQQVFLMLLQILIFSANAFAQQAVLRERLQSFVRDSEGDIGIAVLGLEDNDTISIHGQRHYPMQSVYKLHLGMAVLQQVDKGQRTLHEQIHVTQKDLLPTYSPLRHEHATGEFDITLGELIHYAVSLSDNNACDILFRVTGGTDQVNGYVHDLGIQAVSIAATEEEMSRDWDVQFTNWTTPQAAVQLLQILYQGKTLSQSSRDLLLKEMISTPRGNKRIKGLLPPGTIVAHKPGTSNTNEQGITAATNDIGIITLPSGKHVALAVFLSNSTASDERREEIIAEGSKLVWDYFSMIK